MNEEEWKQHIDSLSAATADTIKDKEKAIELIKEKLISAVEKRAQGNFGVLFSGGIDSTIIAFICRMLKKDFTCYTVGIKGSKDIESSTAVSEKLGFNLVKKELSLDEVDSSLKKVVKMIPINDVVNIEIATVELAAVELAKNNGEKTLFSGLGAEEIFAGYQRHADAEDANKECWSGLRNMWDRDFPRDFAITSSAKVKLLTPFLDDELIKTTMQLPSEWKVSKDEKKIILREAAVQLGIPEEFAFRKKSAAQYGSSITKAVDKISRNNGFKYKKDYISFLQT